MYLTCKTNDILIGTKNILIDLSFLGGGLGLRVGETNIKSSDPNSEPQGITNYDFELPCKISDHSDQFGLGPHPPPLGKGMKVFSSCF